jgi:hypothetical protein
MFTRMAAVGEFAEMTRSGRRPYRVVAHGLGYFCKKLQGLVRSNEWEVLARSGHSPQQLLELARDLAQCDLVYTWGGRISMGKFLWAARMLGKQKLVMLWSGSDVLFAQQQFANGILEPWITKLVHWAVSPWVAEEVRALGLPCEYVQASFVELVTHPKPLPDRFSVLIFVRHAGRTELYGWDRMLEVAERLPKIAFNLCGLPPGQSLKGPANIRVHNWMEDFTPMLEQTTVVYRPVRHDGLSFTVLEALSLGRHVLYSYPLPGCVQVTDSSMACQELEKLSALHDAGALGLNEIGRNYISAHYAPEKVRSELTRRWEQIILS